MLTHPTLEKLKQMRLTEMVSALEDNCRFRPDIMSLSFEERLKLLVDREQTVRNSRRLKTQLTQGKLRQQACMEDIDYKTFITCALTQKACREEHTALYLRLLRLPGDLTIAKADSQYGKLILRFSKIDAMVLDDWGPTPMSADNRRDLVEILDDRYERRSTLINSQLPVENGICAWRIQNLLMLFWIGLFTMPNKSY